MVIFLAFFPFALSVRPWVVNAYFCSWSEGPGLILVKTDSTPRPGGLTGGRPQPPIPSSTTLLRSVPEASPTFLTSCVQHSIVSTMMIMLFVHPKTSSRFARRIIVCAPSRTTIGPYRRFRPAKSNKINHSCTGPAASLHPHSGSTVSLSPRPLPPQTSRFCFTLSLMSSDNPPSGKCYCRNGRAQTPTGGLRGRHHHELLRERHPRSQRGGGLRVPRERGQRGPCPRRGDQAVLAVLQRGGQGYRDLRRDRGGWVPTKCCCSCS